MEEPIPFPPLVKGDTVARLRQRLMDEYLGRLVTGGGLFRWSTWLGLKRSQLEAMWAIVASEATDNTVAYYTYYKYFIDWLVARRDSDAFRDMLAELGRAGGGEDIVLRYFLAPLVSDLGGDPLGPYAAYAGRLAAYAAWLRRNPGEEGQGAGARPLVEWWAQLFILLQVRGRWDLFDALIRDRVSVLFARPLTSEAFREEWTRQTAQLVAATKDSPFQTNRDALAAKKAELAELARAFGKLRRECRITEQFLRAQNVKSEYLEEILSKTFHPNPEELRELAYDKALEQLGAEYAKLCDERAAPLEEELTRTRENLRQYMRMESELRVQLERALPAEAEAGDLAQRLERTVRTLLQCQRDRDANDEKLGEAQAETRRLRDELRHQESDARTSLQKAEALRTRAREEWRRVHADNMRLEALVDELRLKLAVRRGEMGADDATTVSAERITQLLVDCQQERATELALLEEERARVLALQNTERARTEQIREKEEEVLLLTEASVALKQQVAQSTEEARKAADRVADYDALAEALQRAVIARDEAVRQRVAVDGDVALLRDALETSQRQYERQVTRVEELESEARLAIGLANETRQLHVNQLRDATEREERERALLEEANEALARERTECAAVRAELVESRRVRVDAQVDALADVQQANARLHAEVEQLERRVQVMRSEARDAMTLQRELDEAVQRLDQSRASEAALRRECEAVRDASRELETSLVRQRREINADEEALRRIGELPYYAMDGLTREGSLAERSAVALARTVCLPLAALERLQRRCRITRLHDGVATGESLTVAQLIERRAYNRVVGASGPSMQLRFTDERGPRLALTARNVHRDATGLVLVTRLGRRAPDLHYTHLSGLARDLVPAHGSLEIEREGAPPLVVSYAFSEEAEVGSEASFALPSGGRLYATAFAPGLWSLKLLVLQTSE